MRARAPPLRWPDVVASPRALLALAATAVLWAGAFPAIKALLDGGLSGVDLAVLRYAVAAPAFVAMLAAAGGLPRLSRGDVARLAVGGILTVVVYHVCLNIGEETTTSGTAAVVIATAPGMTLLLAIGAGAERATWRRTAGLALAFAGTAVVVTLGSGGSVSLEDARGPLLVAAAALAFAVYNVLVKPLLPRLGAIVVTAAASLFGAVALVPFARASTWDGATGLSAGDAALLLYLGIACTPVAYLLWNVGLKGMDASLASAFLYPIPLIATALGAALLDEPVTAWLVVGGGLIVGGVALAQSRPRALAAAVKPAAEPAGAGARR
jgi:drug/metabolite transporter (DMT)-like permease